MYSVLKFVLLTASVVLADRHHGSNAFDRKIGKAEGELFGKDGRQTQLSRKTEENYKREYGFWVPQPAKVARDFIFAVCFKISSQPK